MTLIEAIDQIESANPKLCWLLRTDGEGYLANVHEDVNLNKIRMEDGKAVYETKCTFAKALTPEAALHNAYVVQLVKRQKDTNHAS